MIFREAKDEDIECLAVFQQRMALETEGALLSKDLLLEGLKSLFLHPEKGTYYVATIDQKLVGCLMINLEWTEWRNGNFVWIQSVYVDPEHRGKGIYKKMYDHIKQQVNQDSSLKGIRLYVDQSNVDAQKVYANLGMDGNHYLMYEWEKPSEDEKK